MRRTSKKLISLCVAVFFLLALTLPAYAQLSDINGHWAAAQINKWVEKGIITGNTDGTYAPDRAITRAEFATIIGRLFNYVDKSSDKFSDVSSTAAYSDAVSKAAAAGIIIGNQGKFRPTEPISRQEAALIITRAFTLTAQDKNAANQFADGKSIPAWSKDAVSAVAENKYMTGRPGNLFDPTASVTRAEVVKIIDNIVQELINTSGTYTGTYDKSLVVNTSDVTLKDAVINGDLILAQGIAEGSVTLDKVTVKGRTLVLGGGENSIHINDSQLIGKLLVIRVGGTVRIVAAGSTEIADTQLLSGANLEGDGFGTVEILSGVDGDTVVLNGDFDEVIIEVPGVSVNVASGTIGKLTVAAAAANTKIQLAGTAKVGTLTADASLQLTGTGTIDKAVINASNVNLAVTPKSVEIKDGLTGVVAGTTPSSGGSSGSGNNNNNNTDTSLSISSVGLIRTVGQPIPGVPNSSGNAFTIDISDESGVLTGLKIDSTPVANKLVVDGVGNEVAGSNGVFSLSGGNSSLAEAVVGYDIGGDVHISTLKSLIGGGSITRKITVYSGSHTKQITLTIVNGTGGEISSTERLLNCYTVTANESTPGVLSAKLKSGKDTEEIFTGSGFYQMLKSMITVPSGYSYVGVAIKKSTESDDTYTEFTKVDLEILQDLKAKTGIESLGDLTLGDLKNKITVQVKAKKGETEHIVTILFK